MSSDDNYIKVIENMINETEGKVQDAVKNDKPRNEIESIKTVLKYLREKKNELIEKSKL